MAKFKVGDRVVVTKLFGRDSQRGVSIGDKGYVIESDHDLGNTINLFNVSVVPAFEGGEDEYVRGRYVVMVDDQLDIDSSGVLDDAIQSYHAACERFEAAQLEIEAAKAAVADAKLAIGAAL